MSGIAYEPMNIGDKVLIHVDEANNPRGYWKGEVLSCVKKGQHPYEYFEVEAKITDQNAEESANYYVKNYYNKCPTTNYTVYPATKSILHFYNKYLLASKETNNVRTALLNKIEALTDLFKSIMGSDIDSFKQKLKNI